MENLCVELLKRYATWLISHQFGEEEKALEGGLYCPSCKTIHGRCIDAVFGLSIAYKTFGDEKYLQGARRLLRYSENLICSDGGVYNDLQTTWRYTTVFFVIDLAETLLYAEDVLPADFVKEIEKHIEIHAKWLFENLDEHSPTNINYPINNALALYLCGERLGKEEYKAKARHLAEYALKHITPSLLLMGEGKPHDKKTRRGCDAIDLGYNLEESLPALVKYAYYAKDEAMLGKLFEVVKAHFAFILPDGAIDNSFGCRNYKWTYYGSRTCDGLLPMALIFGAKEPSFLECARRNLKLMEACSEDGALSGGVDYHRHGENPCIHHTFEHINSLAFSCAICKGDNPFTKPCLIPSDFCYEAYYPEMDSYRRGGKNFLFDISCYDENIAYSGHASGATLTMLFSREKGPLVMGSVGDYALTEPTNMQVPLDLQRHRALLPRFETNVGGKLFSSAYYTETEKIGEDGLIFRSGLMSREGEKLEGSEFRCAYFDHGSTFLIKLSNIHHGLPYLLPLINGNVSIKVGRLVAKEEIFFLTPGFLATEYKVEDVDGEIEIEIS